MSALTQENLLVKEAVADMFGDTTEQQEGFADIAPAFPTELKKLNRWIVRDEKKFPYSAFEDDENRGPIDPHDAQFQSSYDNALGALEQSTKFAGLGFVFNYQDGYTGIDFDDCVQDGKIRADVLEIIQKLDTYCEFSPSGAGVHAYVKGWMFPIGAQGQEGAKIGKAEIYSGKRYFTVTGNQVPGTPGTINVRNVQWMYDRIVTNREFATKPIPTVTGETKNTPSNSARIIQTGTAITTKFEIFMHGKVSTNPFVVADDAGNRIEDYTSQSEADLALATLLAGKYGNDPETIDREFRKSALYRTKWEREDYRNSTIQKAIAFVESQNTQNTQNAQVANSAQAVVDDEEPEENFETSYATSFPQCPIFTGALTDLAAALYPSLPIEFKQMGMIARWGLLRSGIDTLKLEKHIQPRFYTNLVAHPNWGKTACINETRIATDHVVDMAKAIREKDPATRSKPRVFGDFVNLASADSGPFLVGKFYELVAEGKKQASMGATSDESAKIMLDPDEISDVFEKARSSNTRVSTLFSEFLKLHSGNRTGNGTKQTGDKPVDKAHLAIIGGVTFQKYKTIWTGTGAGGDGLMSRFVPMTTNASQVPAIPLQTDTLGANKAYERLAKLALLPAQEIVFDAESSEMLSQWWAAVDSSKKHTARVLEMVKALLIVLAVTNAPENHTGTTLTVGPDLMRQAIAFGVYVIATRELLNPEDAWSPVQAMENAVIDWMGKNASRKDPKSRNDARRGIQPHRMPGGLGAFRLGWDNCVQTDVLKLRGKTQRAGLYSL